MKNIIKKIICLIILCLVLIGFNPTVTATKTSNPLQSIQVIIEGHSFIEAIQFFHNIETNELLLFLPAATDLNQLRIINLNSDTTFELNGTSLKNQDHFAKDLKPNTTYPYKISTFTGSTISGNFKLLQSANIPTMFIETDSLGLDFLHESKDNKLAGTTLLIDEKGNRLNYSTLEYIKGRGNSTWISSLKKSYQIKLENKYNYLGMDSAKKWILMSNSMDHSYMRNKIIYDFSYDIGLIAPESEYIDLYINGEYLGNYLLMEKVDIGKGRVDITNLEEYNNELNPSNISFPRYISPDGNIKAFDTTETPVDITGGYLVEKDTEEQYNLADVAFKTNRGNTYVIISPDNASIEQVTYIKNLFDEMETTMYSDTLTHPETKKRLSDYIDYDSFARRILIDEVFNNPDATGTSNFYYKDSDSVDPLIYAGPVWDYDRSSGNYIATLAPWLDSPNGIKNFGIYTTQLLNNESFYELYTSIFRDDFSSYINKDLDFDIEKIRKDIFSSITLDSFIPNITANYYTTFESEINFFHHFVKARTDSLYDILVNNTVYHTVTFKDSANDRVIDVIKVKHGDYLPYIPYTASYEGIFEKWINVGTSLPLIGNQPILEDTTYNATWISNDIIIQNVLAMEGLLDEVAKFTQRETTE